MMLIFDGKHCELFFRAGRNSPPAVKSATPFDFAISMGLNRRNSCTDSQSLDGRRIDIENKEYG